MSLALRERHHTHLFRWAIRNCALLLLRSLIDCLFGTGESKMSLESGWDGRTIRVSYNKYPTLPGVLLGLLQYGAATDQGNGNPDTGHLQIKSQQAAAESVFPALDIIRRAGPPEAYRAELYRAVLEHLGSHLWHVREMAARTISSFLIARDWAADVRSLLLDGALASTNRLHGTLLAVRFVCGRATEVSKDAAPGELPRLLLLLHALAQRNAGFVSCPEVRAAYLETCNTMYGLALEYGIRLQQPTEEAQVVEASTSVAPSALLKAQTALQSNYNFVDHNDRGALESLMSSVAHTDPDTAARLLNAVPMTWFPESKRTADTAAWLCSMYAGVGLQTAVAADVRATALLHLAGTMDFLLTTGKHGMLPGVDTLKSLWSTTAKGDIGPALSWAALRVSGPIMATAVIARTVTAEEIPDALSVPLWAAMMSNAGDASQTFDTRKTAVEALRSFALAGRASSALSSLPDEDLLPFVFCVYDALNDDDEEIRDIAAEAAGPVLDTTLIPGEAARRLPMWMATRFKHIPAFHAQAAGRMEGQATAMPVTISWPAASTLLRGAMEFDDALFLVEEQNLFVDEVREARRWAEVVESLGPTAQEGSVAAWLAEGLASLVDFVRAPDDGGDGPLGWSAAPSVFAVCARLIIGTRAVVGASNMDSNTTRQLASLLDVFQKAGAAKRVHGLLLAMAMG